MQNFLNSLGWFVYPLGLCSFLAIFVIVERMFALRRENVFPRSFQKRFIAGEVTALKGDDVTVCGRIVKFFYEKKPDAEALKSYADLELTRLERGFFILDIVVGVAPLLGLMGTIAGLVKVFGSFDLTQSLPDTPVIVSGIALALSTTLVGLSIAIPAMIGMGWLNRRVDIYDAQLTLIVEQLIHASGKRESKAKTQDSTVA